MSNTNNFLTAEPITGTQIVEEGDVALLLKKNGAVQALTFGYDRNRLLQPAECLTEDDKAMLEQGKKLFALAFAAGHPQLMQTLLDIASDPNIVDLAALKASTVRH